MESRSKLVLDRPERFCAIAGVVSAALRSFRRVPLAWVVRDTLDVGRTGRLVSQDDFDALSQRTGNLLRVPAMGSEIVRHTRLIVEANIEWTRVHAVLVEGILASPMA